MTISVPGEGATVQILRHLLEHLREGAIFVRYDMRVVFFNAAARQHAMSRGADPTTYPGRVIWDILGYPPDLPSRRAVEQAARDRLPAYLTTRGTFGPYWVELDIVPLEDGILLTYRDATPSRGAAVAQAAVDRELRMTNERLQVVIDEAPLAILVIDNDARVLHWNPAAEAMFQWTEAEILGKPLPLIPDEERAAFEVNAERARRGESLRANPSRRKRKDGVVLDVQISSSPLRNEQGDVTGAIVMITDVTSQRKLEAQLRMAQKMEAVGLLAGGVAHDFNNLLTAIKGFASLLEMTLAPDEQGAEFLAEINKAADRAAGLTSQLLAFSRRQLLRPEALDLNARVREIERMLRVLLRDDAELLFDLDPELSQVLADPGQVQQVILNLMVNARDAVHGRSNGKVTLRTRNAELRDEFAQWGVEDAPGHYVRLDVEDNGMGMDRATQARIFDPFFTTKEPGQGTGLGLATVFGIVKQSNGYVWVRSAPDEGATFSVYLPRARGVSRVSGAAMIIDGSGRNETVLLVEDEDAVRRVARRALELHGYRVIEAADGQTAIELASHAHVDILVTDVMMPGILGPRLADELRARRPQLPVLFMSGHTDEIVRDGLLDPATPFLGKPFTPSQLAHKVREAIEQARNGA
ncbi:MAG: PAS domain-containing protein [Gemmatimonadota bacterium]